VTSPPRTLEILAEGEGAFHQVDPDGFRAWVAEHKDRALTPKLMTEKEAVQLLVADGDYLDYDCNYILRGPNSLMHEIIRQGKRDLWLNGKFTYVDVALLVGGGCVSRVDCGFFMAAPVIQQAAKDGRLEIFEYSNVVQTLRLRAGAMGIPFLPVRSLGGTDGFRHSGAKLIRDPYTGDPVTIIPALNPDVSIIHAHQSDIYGNARIFGTGVSHEESGLASRKVIVSAEEIIDTEEIRRDPGRTSIPYYAVDAVVHAPYGAYPGNCPGRYASDPPAVMEVFRAIMTDGVQDYLDKWISPFETYGEMLDELVGAEKLKELEEREVIQEGYRA